MRYGMMLELDKCVGCQACVTACKERWDSGPGAARDWVLEFEHGQRGKDLGLTFFPGLCMHCEDHPCTMDCPTGATYMNPNGIVVVDPEVCIGCGNCIPMCPYGARHADGTKGIVEKCNFCAPYLERGKQPACVATCLAECRHFGDLDDPESEISRLIVERGAEPLTTPEVQVRPKVSYAPAQKRANVLAQNVVREPNSTWLTRLWQGATRPAAQVGAPTFAAAAVLGGLVVNFRTRKQRAPDPAPPSDADQARATDDSPPSITPSQPSGTRLSALPRHRGGMRFLHWFNALSWLLLLASGTALMIAPSFALFGVRFPALVSRLVGGPANLLLFHVLFGLLWALVIMPTFLLYKRGGIEALREIRLTRDDLRWFLYKPRVLMGIGNKSLPPQDKYNAGQKVFAISALVGTSLIIGSGLVMTFHLGSAAVVSGAILVHKLAILLALFGLAVHITMAAILKEERPALMSMLRGVIDREHAEHHSAKWVHELEDEANGSTNEPTPSSKAA